MVRSGEVKPLSVLLVAEHASAAFGGEALIPFQYFKNLRELDIDVHLLVHERTKTELSEAFSNDLERLHFVRDSWINIWCHKIGSLLPERLAVFTLGALSHFDTQLRQRDLARVLVQELVIDVVHEPIPVSPKLPSILWDLKAPVIIGPMNGGMDFPPLYNKASAIEKVIVSGLRFSATFWNWLLPGKRQAALLLVANKRSQDALPSALKLKRILKFVETGVDLGLFYPSAKRPSRDYFRAIYVGRLVDWKRVDLLIEACAHLKGKISFELELIGDGPMRGALAAQVRQMSLSDYVHFRGRLPQQETANILRDADVMVLPSMRECGGAVVLEAMASGIPVVATKWGGPIDYITPETGILIPPLSPELFTKELANALLFLAENPTSRVKMGDAGRKRASALYGWKAKARAILDIYKSVLTVPSPSMNESL